MKHGKPAYFDAIRKREEKEWEHIRTSERYGNLCKRLFETVQHPRHVLSELLQNADDAGAKNAIVRIEEQEGKSVFIFEHDGKDFEKEQFDAICKFACSSKKLLHTIGFLGIGFKSTFSIGAPVQLITPSLAVYFNKKQFTLPHLLDKYPDIKENITRIQILETKTEALDEARNNFDEWDKNPFSLFFFKNIKSLKIEEKEIRRRKVKQITKNVSHIKITSATDRNYLYIKSGEKEFPAEAIEEIKEERWVEDDESLTLPPCQVEIVVCDKGRLEGQLYTVLPTEIKTDLPFACNAPFIPDTSRRGIKDLSQSPTNRWLLEQIGELAAKAMLEILQDKSLPVRQRAQAYDFMPDVDMNDDSLENEYAKIVQGAFDEAVQEEAILLTQKGDVVGINKGIAIDKEIADIWGLEKATKFLDDEKQQPLCQFICRENVDKLANRHWVKRVNRKLFFNLLKNCHLRKPSSVDKIAHLLAYVSRNAQSQIEDSFYPNRYTDFIKSLRILPVHGEKILYSANEVTRFDVQKFQTKNDREFLTECLKFMDMAFVRHLSKGRKKKSDSGDINAEFIESARIMLDNLSLGRNTEAKDLIEKASNILMKQDESQSWNREIRFHPKYVQLAHIAANFGADVGGNFPYFARNKKKNRNITFDANGILQKLIPESHRDSDILHSAYMENFTSCTKEKWLEWAKPEKSGLYASPMLEKKEYYDLWSEERLQEKLTEMGHSEIIKYETDKNKKFSIVDYNFNSDYWEHWEKLVLDDKNLWGDLLELLRLQGTSYWENKLNLNIRQHWPGKKGGHELSHNLSASWINKLRIKACLPDTDENYDLPQNLLRETEQTISQAGIDKFLNYKWKKEAYYPLLDRLEVGTIPSGPEKLLKMLRNLKSENSIERVQEIYDRLNKYVRGYLSNDGGEENDSSEKIEMIKKTFTEYSLVLTESHGWLKPSEVFLNSGELELSSVPIIEKSVNSLSLWREIGIEKFPQENWVIGWVKKSSEHSSSDLKICLEKYPLRIWRECKKWLNLAGGLVETSQLQYAAHSSKHEGLYDSIKEKTADFTMISDKTILQKKPFPKLPRLSHKIEIRLSDDSRGETLEGLPDELKTIGEAIQRLKIDNEEEAKNVHKLGKRLAKSNLKKFSILKSTPCIDDVIIGESRKEKAVWVGNSICVESIDNMELIVPLAKAVSKVFTDKEKMKKRIKEALIYSSDGRDIESIKRYMEKYFDLMEAPAQPSETDDHQEAGNPQDTQGGFDTENDPENYDPNRSSKPRGFDPDNQSNEGQINNSENGTYPNAGRPNNGNGGNGSKVHGQGNSSPNGGQATNPSTMHATSKGGYISNPETENAAIEAVLAFEKKAGRKAEDMNEKKSNNPGFDILSTDNNGEERLIEVKGLQGKWGAVPVFLSSTQMECSYKNNGKSRNDKNNKIENNTARKFWLYVVENAQDEHERKIYCLEAPSNYLDGFYLKGEWRHRANETDPKDSQ